MLLAHIASHKRELQLAEERAEERGAAQITDLKLHHKNLMSQILLNRKVNDQSDTDTDTNTVSTSEDLTSNQINNQKQITAGWKKVAEGLVEFRSNNHKSNEFHVKRIFAENAVFLAPILAICPNVKCLLANVLTNAVSRNTKKARVSPGSEASRLKNLTEAEGERESLVEDEKKQKINPHVWLAHSCSCSFGQILPEVPSGQQGVCCSRGRVAPCQHNFTTSIRSLSSIRLNNGISGKAPSRFVQHGARKTSDIGRSSLNYGYDN